MLKSLRNKFSKKKKQYQNAEPSQRDSSMEDTYFIQPSFSQNSTIGAPTMAVGYNDNGPMTEGTYVPLKKTTEKIKATPKSVLHELERIPTKFDLIGLDDKIQILKDKEKLINQHYAKAEVKFLITCLENRKKYWERGKDGKLYREFFQQFDATNQEKIADLLKKYELVQKSADIFIPEFPDVAVKIMKEFNEKVQELCDGKKASFTVIATEESFKEAYKKRDPILLAQSPFGMYLYILGAWDTEMLYLPEL